MGGDQSPLRVPEDTNWAKVTFWTTTSWWVGYPVSEKSRQDVSKNIYDNVKVGCFSSGYLQFSGKSTDANRFCISFSKNLFFITLSSLNDHKTAKFLVALYVHLQSVALIAAVTVFS